MIQETLLEFCKNMRELLDKGDTDTAKKALDHMIEGLINKDVISEDRE